MDELLPDEDLALSLPSLRVEALNRIPQSPTRSAGFARPASPSRRRPARSGLRKVINKEGFDEEQIFTAVQNAARSGWESVKFYFMIGLPTETQDGPGRD